MTTLEYFAAHAPEEIPKWFQPPPFPEVEPRDPWHEWGTKDRISYNEWVEAANDSGDDRIRSLLKIRREYFEARNAWIERRNLHNFFAWRWAFALGMVNSAPEVKA